MKFKLMAGLHVQDEGTPPKGIEGQPGFVPASKDYRAGVTYDANGKLGKNVVETNTDLVAKFGPEKFQRLDADTNPSHPHSPPEGSGTPGGPQSFSSTGDDAGDAAAKGSEAETDELDSMTVAELRAYAEDHEIEVEHTARKQEIIDAIRSAEKSQK